MLEDLLSAYGSRLVIAVLGVGIALLLLVVALWMIRGRNGPSPFVRGGKNRQPRLQVLDAAAVDARRRLVLVRRDNVEHLVMIGGPTDIVIESGISTGAAGVNAASASAASRSTPLDPSDMTVPFSALPAAESRTALAQRPVPPEPRVEPVRERSVSRDATRPAPAVMPLATGPGPMDTTPPRPAPPIPAAPPEHAVAPKIELPVRQATDVKPEPLRPVGAVAAATTSAHSLDIAANVLDAARERVLQDVPEPRVAPANPAAVPPVLQPAAEKLKQLGSDFERILEQEMANNLAAREAAALGQPPAPTLPRNPSAAPRVTGATPEPSLQTEVARIFGEMSVNRDK